MVEPISTLDEEGLALIEQLIVRGERCMTFAKEGTFEMAHLKHKAINQVLAHVEAIKALVENHPMRFALVLDTERFRRFDIEARKLR